MEFVHVDKQGRMVLPKKLREEFDTQDFAAEKEERRIVLIPVRSLKYAVGLMPNIDMEAHKREHAKER